MQLLTFNIRYYCSIILKKERSVSMKHKTLKINTINHFHQKLIFIIFISFPTLVLTQISSHSFLFTPNTNPGFSALSEKSQIIINYRNQWPGLNNAFVTYKAGVFSLPLKNNLGFGFNLTNDISGDGIFTKSDFDFIFTYRLKTGLFSNIGFFIQPSLFQTKIQTKNILKTEIPDWVENFSETQGFVENTINPDFATGFVYKSKKINFGFNLSHLLKPKINEQERIDMEYNIFFAYTKTTKNQFKSAKNRLEPMIMFSKRDKYSYLFTGVRYKMPMIEPGIYLRQSFSSINSSTLILSSKFIFLNLFMVYSFDAMLTNRSLTFNNFGVHEVTLGYQFEYKGKRNTKQEAIICPY